MISTDVREANDFADAHIPGAFNLPISVFEEALSLDPGKEAGIERSLGACPQHVACSDNARCTPLQTSLLAVMRSQNPCLVTVSLCTVALDAVVPLL